MEKEQTIQTAEQFNQKYRDYLIEGYSGLQFSVPEATEYLDKQMQELIKIPGFKYNQIKAKFNWFCFYAENVSPEKRFEIEQKLKEICDNQTIDK